MTQLLTQFTRELVETRVETPEKPYRLSVSSLCNFGTSCRRQWQWDQTWYSPKGSTHLFLGKVVHECLDLFFFRLKKGDTIGEAGVTMLQHLESIFAWELRQELEVWNRTITPPDIELIETMLTNYCFFERDYRTNHSEWRVLDVEKPMVHAIPGLDNVVLSGRADLIVEIDGEVWIVDHKTSATKPSLSGLEVDEQTTAYCWLYWRETGIKPRGVIYDVLVKAAPQRPRPLARGGLSKDRSQATTYALYLDEIKARGLNVDDYADILETLRLTGWSNYFARSEADRSQIELESFERHLRVKAQDAMNVLRNDMLAYPSASTYGCSYCSFLGICKSAECGEDYGAILEQTMLLYADALGVGDKDQGRVEALPIAIPGFLK